jgi:hypothetical protein
MPEFESNQQGQACQFVDDFQRLVGEDSEPDALFFVESWTLGKSAAVQNFQQRRQRPVEYERPMHTFNDLYSPSVVSFLQQCVLDAKFLSAAGAASSAGRYYTDGARQSSEEPAARTQDRNPQQGRTFAGSYESYQPTVHPMTLQRACQLLGVTAASTREQIKTAYRRMAGQWHPDRVETSTEPVQRIATEQMAAINEAYHMLRGGLSQESA